MQQLPGNPEDPADLAPRQSHGAASQHGLLVAGARTFQAVTGSGEFTHASTAENVSDDDVVRGWRQWLALVNLTLETLQRYGAGSRPARGRRPTTACPRPKQSSPHVRHRLMTHTGEACPDRPTIQRFRSVSLLGCTRLGSPGIFG